MNKVLILLFALCALSTLAHAQGGWNFGDEFNEFLGHNFGFGDNWTFDPSTIPDEIPPGTQPKYDPKEAYEDFKRGVLFEHNFHRREARCNPVVWAEDLAASAKSYAERFEQNNQPKRNYNEPGLLAQYGDDSETMTLINWAWGRHSYKPGKPGAYPYVYKAGKKEEDIFAYTQMVWKSTSQVGCARTANYFVCRYFPRGNQYGVPPF